MRQTIKNLFWIGCLALGVQTAGAFALLGPITGTPDAAWQITQIGYNPLPGFGPPFFIDGLDVGPKNLDEGYRRNAQVMYYAFDPSWEWFGSNGEYAVQQAFDMLNGVLNGQTNNPVYLYSPTNGVLGDTNGGPTVALSPTNSLDTYSPNLTEFPFNSMEENYTAYGLGLLDVKSMTLSLLMEQLGLADSIRYIWILHNRYTGLEGESCNPPGPGFNVEYNVVQRNFDLVPSPLGTNIQYSPYVNGELYSYWIDENCGAPGGSPPDVDALEIPANNFNVNPPVASGHGSFFLRDGFFYTGLTRDDVGGLRWLYSTNNYDTPSAGYRESPAAGSALMSYSTPQLLYTSNYNSLFATSLTNDPATLQAMYPDIQFSLMTNYFSNEVSASMAYVTNYPIGGIAGQGYVGLQTTYTTNIIEYYHYSFANVVTNLTPFIPYSIHSNTTYALQTITVGSPVGSPVGTPFVTNVTYQTFQSNVVSGDYFVITNGSCPPDIQQVIQTNVMLVTNTLVAVTNTDGSSIVQNLVSYFTNYVFVVRPCTLATNVPADYLGLGRMQFIRTRDDNFDYLSGQFVTPITNQYHMVVFENGQYVTQTFQRIVTTPDFLFEAADQLTGPDAIPVDANLPARNVNFNTANMQTGLSGPGTIDSPTTFVFNKVGPVYDNLSPGSMIGPDGASTFWMWGSFDGTTNQPIVYPNGTSLENLAAAAVVQISTAPPSPSPNILPEGTKGVSYHVTFAATGTVGSVTWALAPVSAGLPHGLTLSASGVISGTPTQSGQFHSVVIQMTDSSSPPRVVQTVYSIKIKP